MNSQIKGMLYTAGAVALGLIVYKIVMNVLGQETEEFAGAIGSPCSAPNAPSTFVEGTVGCDRMTDCANRGGTPTAEPFGTGYKLGCIGASMNPITVGQNGSVRNRVSAFKSIGL